MKQATAHSLVATAMIVTFITVAISQDWWLEFRYYIESRTMSTPPTKPTNTNVTDTTTIIKWLIGLGGSWVIFSLLVDIGDTAELSEALAILLMGTVLFLHGPKALSNLGVISLEEAKASGSS